MSETEDGHVEIVGAEVVAEGLGFPEGPLVLGPGRVAWVEQYPGRVAIVEDGAVRTLAHVGGSPNGLALAPDGAIFVTQNGGKLGDWYSEDPRVPGLQVILPDGTVETAVTEAGGRPLRRPNDLCFAPDGSLWFTDPGDYAPDEAIAGWICRYAGGVAEIVHELDNVYPNGIAIDHDGRVLWVETHTHLVRSADGVVADLGPEGTGDGFALADDGTLLVGTAFSGALHVVAPGADGARAVTTVRWADDLLLSNCAFDGHALWVTDATTGWERSDAYQGRLWRLELSLHGTAL